jgi:hypothetical protein
MRNWGSSVSIVPYYTARPGFDPRHRQIIFPLASVSRLALSPTHPPCPMGTGVKRGRDVTLTTHPRLLPRLGVSRSYSRLPLSACMAVAGQLYFYIYCHMTRQF